MKDALLYISPMTAQDLNMVLVIERESFPSPWTYSLFRQELDLSFSRHLVLRRSCSDRNGEIIGYIIFWIIHDEVQLQRIAVKKDSRCKGMGNILIGEMMEVCLQEGVKSGSLEVRASNYSALRLYKKLGFQVAGMRKGYYTDTQDDALLMDFLIDRNSHA